MQTSPRRTKTYPRTRVAKVHGRWHVIRVRTEWHDTLHSVELVHPYATGYQFWRDARNSAFGR